MIPGVSRIRTNLRYYVLRLGALLRLSGFLGLPSPVGTLLLRLVMGVRFLVVVATLAAEEEENLLRVTAAHIASLSSWPRAVKRTTLPRGEILP
jgi:hypothetical protein